MKPARDLAAWLLAAAILAGCASRPVGPIAEPTPPPPAYEPEGPEDFTGPMDQAPQKGRPRPPSAQSPRPAPSTPPAEAVAPPDTLRAPTISVELSDEERARLTRATEDDLTLARSTVARLEATAAAPGKQEAIATLRDLIDSAAQARERDDLRAAAQLARKARLLADELARGR